MGSNKAFLPIEGVPLIKHIRQTTFGNLFKIILSTASANAFEDIAGTQVVDRYPETGPARRNYFCSGDRVKREFSALRAICHF